MTLDVYVPRAGSPLEAVILGGSAVVGSPAGGGRVRIDYEGNRYGSPSLASYAARLLHAAGRHVENYPTVARSVVPEGALLLVGRYDPDTGAVDYEDSAALVDWLGGDEYLP